MMTKRSSEREQGFTLIELLMAISISGILIAAIATGFIASMRGTASAHERLVASNGAHTLSTYFTADVESANPDLNSDDPMAPLGCFDEPPDTTTNVLRLQWSEMTTATELRSFSVSYRILPFDTDGDTVDDEWQLVRYSCSAKSPDILSDGPLNDHIVVDHLHKPIDPFITKATINDPARPQDISLRAFAVLAKGELAPYDYTFSATMRTPEPVPHVSSISRNGTALPNAASVSWIVTFSEAVTGVDLTSPFADFAFVYTGNLAGASVTSATGSGTTYTVTANTGTGQGTLALKVGDNGSIVSASTVDDDQLGGDDINNGSYTGEAYTIDRLSSGVVVNRNSTQAPTASSVPIPNAFTATFNENVSDFDDAADVVDLGTAGAVFSIGPNPAGTAGKDYLLSVTSVTGSGPIIPRVIAGAATDSAGNSNTVSTNGASNLVTYGAAATPTIASVDLWNGGGAAGLGKIAQGDKVIVTFSGAMSESSFCSDWTGASTDRLSDTNNKVTVTVTNGASGAHDRLTVTTGNPVCSGNFNFGSIDLGSGAYVSTNTTFAGADLAKSKIEWTSSTKTLTITLGAPSTVPTATVVTSAPIYTADPDIRTSPPGTVNNSPYALANEQQF